MGKLQELEDRVNELEWQNQQLYSDFLLRRADNSSVQVVGADSVTGVSYGADGSVSLRLGSGKLIAIGLQEEV